MLNLLLFILMACGLTNIITSEYIFEPVREWWQKVWKWEKMKYLISCPVCCGFWVGLGLSFPFDLPFWIAPFAVSFIMKLVVVYENHQ